MSLVCHWYLIVCYSYVTPISFLCHSYVNSMHSYAIRYVVVYHSHVTCISIICHLYVLVCHSYTIHVLYVIRMSLVCHLYITRMYSDVIRMSPLCTRMSMLCHSYVLVCHSSVTRMPLVYTRMSHVCVFTMNLQNSLSLLEMRLTNLSNNLLDNLMTKVFIFEPCARREVSSAYLHTLMNSREKNKSLL